MKRQAPAGQARALPSPNLHFQLLSCLRPCGELSFSRLLHAEWHAEPAACPAGQPHARPEHTVLKARAASSVLFAPPTCLRLTRVVRPAGCNASWPNVRRRRGRRRCSST